MFISYNLYLFIIDCWGQKIYIQSLYHLKYGSRPFHGPRILIDPSNQNQHQANNNADVVTIFT